MAGSEAVELEMQFFEIVSFAVMQSFGAIRYCLGPLRTIEIAARECSGEANNIPGAMT
jgi:hypothetical protein